MGSQRDDFFVSNYSDRRQNFRLAGKETKHEDQHIKWLHEAIIRYSISYTIHTFGST